MKILASMIKAESSKVKKALNDFKKDLSSNDDIKDIKVEENNGEVIILSAMQDNKKIFFIASVSDIEKGTSFLSSHNKKTSHKWGLSENEVTKYM